MAIRKALLPVAGRGTRFLPATKAVPKELLSLVGRPILQHVVEEAVASGVTDICLVTSRDKKAIEDHFDTAPDLEALLARQGKTDLLDAVRGPSSMARFCAVRQGCPRGLGHAVGCGRTFAGADAFAVLLGDDVFVADPPGVAQMAAVHDQFGGAPVLGVQPVPWEHVSRYGIVGGEEVRPGVMRVRRLIEKPQRDEAPSNLAIIGRYVLTPDIFDHIDATPADRRGEIQLTDAIARLMADRPLYAVVMEGRRFDTGTPLGHIQANIALALEDPRLGPPLRAFLGDLLASPIET